MGLYLWRQGSSRVFLHDDWLHGAPAISLRASGTESDRIDLVAHCPVGKVLSGKYQNTINNAQLPGSVLGLQCWALGTRSTSVASLQTGHQSGEVNGSNREPSEAGQGHLLCKPQVPVEMS